MPSKYYTQEKVEEIKRTLDAMVKETPQRMTQKTLILSIKGEINTLLKKGWSLNEIAQSLSKKGTDIPINALKTAFKKPKKPKV